MLFADRIGPRLAIGWTMGTLVSALGVWLSVEADLPTGATIVCTFGGALLVIRALRAWSGGGSRPEPVRSAANVAAHGRYETALPPPPAAGAAPRRAT
jgi:zinc/manganese transport system permease protein